MPSTASRTTRPRVSGNAPGVRDDKGRWDPPNAAEDALIQDMLTRIDQILDATAQITDRLQRRAA